MKKTNIPTNIELIQMNTELTYVDKQASPFVRGVLYGEMGHWKTVTAASCINATGPTATGLVVAADEGYVSLQNHPEIWERIRVVRYEGLSQLRHIALNETAQDLVVLDTVSQMQEEYVDFLMDNTKWGGNYREKSIPNKGSKVLAEEIPGLPDYHVTRNKMRVPLRMMLQMPCDVIFLCHVREPSFLEVQKNKLVRRPSLTQKLYEFIGREAHFIGFMEKRVGKHATISFKSDPKTAAKSRIGLLNEQIIQAPDLPEILKKWKESL